MKTVYELAVVDRDACIGCKNCENVCPTAAIVVSNRKAEIDEQLCSGCNRCVDGCNDEALSMIKRAEPLVLGIDPEELEKIPEKQIAALCRKANFEPEEPICVCTFTRAKEVAAVIIRGAKTPEEVSLQTGTRTVCAMWCSTPVQRLLRAHGVEVDDAPGFRQYNVDVDLWRVSDEVAKKYPEYSIEEDKKASKEGKMDNFAANFW